MLNLGVSRYGIDKGKAADLAPPRAVCQHFGEDGEYAFALGTEEGEKAVPRPTTQRRATCPLCGPASLAACTVGRSHGRDAFLHV